MSVDADTAAPQAPAEGRVVEWFRSGSRVGVLRAILPAVLCATLGWLLLVVASRIVESRLPAAALTRRVTLPPRAVVTAEGDPFEGGSLEPHESALVVAGMLVAMASPIVLAVRLLRRVEPEGRELLLRTDGLVLREGDRELRLAWSEVEEIVHRPARGDGERARVALVRHDGSEVALDADFADVAPAELARRIRQVRNRAVFGMLDAPAWPERRGDQSPKT